MKLLRKVIKKLILEGIKDDFEERWYNVEEERAEWDRDAASDGTMHKDQLKQTTDVDLDDEIDELFKNKRDLKTLWNTIIDENDLRDFWEGPQMEYFHSLVYYGFSSEATDSIVTGVSEDESIKDLSAIGFINKYKKSGNKDEMSAYGIFNMVTENIDKLQKDFGVMISGRVTLASNTDAFTESRSKASAKDIEVHTGSGMPKRIMPTGDMIASLLFEPQDIITDQKIGECILDNWSIEAVVYNPKGMDGVSIKEAAKQMADHYDVPLLTSQEQFGYK